MKRYKAHSLVAATMVLLPVLSSPAAVAPPEPLLPIPTSQQLAWHDDVLTVFVHYGMNTHVGESNLGSGKEDPNSFNPPNLDCSQWARESKACGFTGMILTAKHHDGFCLWPTKTTTYSVASSSWRDGKGDVVRELADACREEGIKFGVYCSPWDRSQEIFETDPPAYAKLHREQVAELMSNYGPIYEMWFDGCNGRVVEFHKTVELVRKLQPGAIIKRGPWTPNLDDVQWVGNEVASARLANWCVYPAPGSSSNAKPIWFPVETDTPMIGHWFWADTLPLSLPTLLNYYYTSVGRGSVLLLNIAPNPEGRFSKESVERMHEFNDALSKIFGNDFAAGKKATASNVRGNDSAFAAEKVCDDDAKSYWATDDGVTTGWVEVDLGAEKTFNVIRMEEMIALGQRVAEYKLEVWDKSSNQWKLVNKGFTIGHRKLDRIPAITSSKVRLTILKSRACPTITSVGVHLDSVSPAEYFTPEIANHEVIKKERMPRQEKIPKVKAED